MKSSEDRLPFWFDDGPAIGASAPRIAEAERHMGLRLPHSLKQLLQERDGGVSNFLAYYRGDTYVPLSDFFGVDLMVSAFDSAEDFGTPSGVLAIASSAHAWLGLDYRLGGDPSVVHQEDDCSEVIQVAGSFDEFLGGMVEDLP